LFWGEGLTNIIFMPPGGLVVEMAGQFNDVNMPVCGYYGTLGAVMGLHHYLYVYHFYKEEKSKVEYPLRPDITAKDALQFYNQIHSLS
jgi:hypothetical protein